MFSSILTGAVCGVDSYFVRAEVDIAQGMPCMEMIGCLSREAMESKERIRVTLRNNGIVLPPMRITINLSPADRHKSGTGFDLPSAIGMLVSLGKLPVEKTRNILFLGELGLNGEIKAVKGILPIVKKAAEEGIGTCIIPAKNSMEAAAVSNVTVLGASHIMQVVSYLKNGFSNSGLILAKKDRQEQFLQEEKETIDFSDVHGQESVKRAMEIAAAGFHHILMIGPPGSGKTMIARRLPTILPPLSMEESLEVSAVYSVSGRLENGRILTRRPFLEPHHTTSGVSLIGGGRIPVPGAVSLAHRGVLFLDELTEFKRTVLDVLRQPMEERKVQIARTYGTIEYPADFMLAAAMNPCPCGYYPDLKKCNCTEAQIRQYLGRISGPILDRIDICAEAAPVKAENLMESGKSADSHTIRERVLKARRMQKQRFAGTVIRFNAEMGIKETEEFCQMTAEAKKLLEKSFHICSLSARAYHKVLKTARTIADLDEAVVIQEKHIAEAVFYRMTTKKYWNRSR